jgi:hypothetical protein
MPAVKAFSPQSLYCDDCEENHHIRTLEVCVACESFVCHACLVRHGSRVFCETCSANQFEDDDDTYE